MQTLGLPTFPPPQASTFPPPQASTAAVQQPTQAHGFTTTAEAYPQGYMPGLPYFPMQPQAGPGPMADPALPYFPMQPQAGPGPMADPARQERIAKLADQAAADYEKSLRRGRASETGAQIFASTIAPALALFGGAGTSSAGVQMIKDTQQEIQNNRMRKIQEEKHYVDVLKGLTDIGNTIGYKPYQAMYQAMIKAQQKATDQAQKQAELDETHSYHGQLVKKWGDTESRLTETSEGNQALRARGIAVNEGRLAQITKTSEGNQALRARGIAVNEGRLAQIIKDDAEELELKKQLAILSAQMQARGQDIRQSQFAQQIAQQLKIYNDTKARTIGNSSEPLESSEPTEQNYFNVDQFANSMPTAAPAQPAAQAAAPATSFKPQFQSIAQQQGHSPDRAKAMFIDAAIRKGGMTYEQAIKAAKGI